MSGDLDPIARRARELPREIEPSRDLWPGIERRLAPRRPRVPRWLPLAAAVALAAGAWLLGRSAARSAPAPVPIVAAPAEGADALLAALEQEPGTLAPETVAALRRNLAVIDSALADSRRALAADPGDAGAARWLAGVERQRAELLRQVVRLPRS